MPKLDYPFIRSWCHYMGSQQYFIDDAIHTAGRDPQSRRSAVIVAWQILKGSSR